MADMTTDSSYLPARVSRYNVHLNYMTRDGLAYALNHSNFHGRSFSNLISINTKPLHTDFLEAIEVMLTSPMIDDSAKSNTLTLQRSTIMSSFCLDAAAITKYAVMFLAEMGFKDSYRLTLTEEVAKSYGYDSEEHAYQETKAVNDTKDGWRNDMLLGGRRLLVVSGLKMSSVSHPEMPGEQRQNAGGNDRGFGVDFM